MQKHVLFAESDVLLRDLFTTVLVDGGMKVTAVSAAQEAIDILDDQIAVDVVVCDVMLSGNNGVELLAELRSYEDWLHIPLVLTSFLPRSYFPLSDAAMHRYGIKAFIYKPHTTPQDLIRQVQRSCNAAVTA